MNGFIDFIVVNKVVLALLLFAISEALSLIPSVKANGIFQFIYGLIKKLYDSVKLPPQ